MHRPVHCINIRVICQKLTGSTCRFFIHCEAMAYYYAKGVYLISRRLYTLCKDDIQGFILMTYNGRAIDRNNCTQFICAAYCFVSIYELFAKKQLVKCASCVKCCFSM